VEPQLRVFQQMKGGVGHPLVLRCASDPEVPLTPINPQERVIDTVLLWKVQLVSRGHEIVPWLIIVGTETSTSALLVARRPTQIADDCLYACKRDMEGSLIASFIRDRHLQVRKLIRRWNQWQHRLLHGCDAADHIVKGGFLLLTILPGPATDTRVDTHGNSETWAS
jgi:hypothetical protein